MEIFRHFEQIPANLRGGAGALGNFDGFHRGHQVVVGEAGRLARKNKKPLVVVMTEPHPRSFFDPDGKPFRLTPFRERLSLVENFGVDVAMVLPFTKELAGMPPEVFVEKVLVNGLGLNHVVVGYDYRFGKKRTGDVKVLKTLGENFGFETHEISPVPFGVEGAAGEPYSSTLVRKALKEGKARKAAALLGHWWTVNGRIIEGEKRGRKLGFPTANLEFQDSIVPAFGVYAIRARVEGEKDLFEGVANVGIRPTFGESRVLLEVFLFDFKADLYGRHMQVHFAGGIRPEVKFSGPEELQRHIEKDIKAARTLLSDPENAHERLLPPTLDEYLKKHPRPL